MHLPTLTLTTLVLLLTPINARNHARPTPLPHHPTRQSPLLQHQHPMDSWQLDTPSGPPLLGDVLPLDKSLSIFSSLTRSVENIQARLNDAGVNTTVLAPGNEAISRLPRKPWEDPEDGEGERGGDKGKYEGMGGEDRAGRNLRRFVEMHCVGVSPWKKGVKVRTVGGGEVWWDEDAEGRKIYPDGIKVKRVQGEVENGALWVLEGVVNYAEKE